MKKYDFFKNIQIDPYRSTSVYLQIARSIESEIINGNLQPGIRIPTVREIAITLGFATSVIQRAMSELQTAGLIISQGTAGTFVSKQEEGLPTTSERMRRFARQTIEEIERLGYDRSTIAQLISNEGKNNG